jgi:hypothetical protein
VRLRRRRDREREIGEAAPTCQRLRSWRYSGRNCLTGWLGRGPKERGETREEARKKGRKRDLRGWAGAESGELGSEPP